MTNASFKDTDHGYAKLVKTVFEFSRPRIDVGILDGSGMHGALTMVELGVIHEFGTDNIPARSFIRGYFDEHEAALREDVRKLMESVIAGKRTKEQILELLGQRAVAQIQARIAAGVAPANAPSTVARKGSSTPLIDTGALRSAVSYRVEDG